MNIYKLNILFVIKINKIRKNGTAPLNFRLTYIGKRKEIATGQFVKPEYWYSKKQLAEPPNDENTNINTQLNLIKTNINRAFLLLQIKEVDFDVDDITINF
ncbi:Arm DNA-binding domain-containing protein [Lutibacter sp.]